MSIIHCHISLNCHIVIERNCKEVIGREESNLGSFTYTTNFYQMCDSEYIKREPAVSACTGLILRGGKSIKLDLIDENDTVKQNARLFFYNIGNKITLFHGSSMTWKAEITAVKLENLKVVQIIAELPVTAETARLKLLMDTRKEVMWRIKVFYISPAHASECE